MSILIMDDPSYYSAAEFAVKYTVTGTMTVSAGNGRFSTASWRLPSNQRGTFTKVLGSALTTSTMAISVKVTGSFPASGAPVTLMAMVDNVTIQVDVRVNNLGQLVVTRNGTTLATSSNVLTLGVVNRIELKVTIDPSAGVIELRVNGSSTGWVPSTGSLNTRATANSSYNVMQVGDSGGSGTNTGTYDFNDFILTDTNSPNANFLGDKRCFLLNATADSSVVWTATFAAYATGAYVLGQTIKDSNNNVQRCTTAGTASTGSPSWSTTGGGTTSAGGGVVFTCVGTGSNPGAHNWMAISEATVVGGVADGDSSYNASSTPNDIDLFTMSSLPAGAQNIAAVDNVRYVRKDDAGTRQEAGQIKSSGTTATGATDTLSTSYQFFDQIQETDPNTSAAWTATGVNNMTVGYKEIA